MITKILQIPPAQRWLAMGGLLVVLGLAYYFLLYSGRVDEIETLNKNLTQLQGEVSKTKTAARRLAALERRLAAYNQELQVAARSLPDSKEIPELLTQVSNIGRQAGLEFLLFQPQGETSQSFYAAVPVKLQIAGTFSQIMIFFRGLSQLPRIVNVTDLKIGGADVQPGRVTLKIECLATTFRFLREQEIREAAQKAVKGGARKAPPASAQQPAKGDAGG
ncbi:MAG: type 4a pilus biogenesis protein PilO [Candidatus Tectomicrobia bacterium]|uniref:Type 4a pilus biogenesis protein PilO n=1 Tax=Tectimicrobiota bacterium TaxID=2528274 RepID=A0A932GPL3_UNCTE|nr:type 4a pilus biogenesis protein PilO [Candidatus Tectomicrobia bacterium]